MLLLMAIMYQLCKMYRIIMATKQRMKKDEFFNSEYGHAEPNPNYERFFNYLRQSLTYKWAWESLKSKDSISREARQIPDFAKVVKTAKDFGQVWDVDFETWWKARGLHQFGKRGDKPEAKVILETGVEFGGLPIALSDAAKQIYGKTGRTDHANYYVELPQSLTRTEMVQFIDELQARIKLKKRSDIYLHDTPLYQFKVNKINASTLDAGHKLLDFYQNTNLEMWRIAAKLHLSHKHEGEVDPEAPKERFVADDIKIKLSITAHKLRKKAVLLAENAARGRFPCVDPLPYLPEYRPAKKIKKAA